MQVLPLQLNNYDTTIHVRRSSRPTSQPVVMIHGIQSHPGWFVDSASILAAAGHPVVQFTRRGSGTNRHRRGHARSVGQLTGDLDRVVDFARSEFSAETIDMVGISWGGKYAACWALRPTAARRLGRMVLIAPGIAPKVTLPLMTQAAIAACSAAAPRRRFEIPLSDPALFTDNVERRRFISEDPDRLIRATAKFLLVSRLMDRRLARAARGALTRPTTLILAAGDRIIDNPRTRAAIDRLTDGRARTVELPGAHTLEFEPDPAAFHAALLEALS